MGRFVRTISAVALLSGCTVIVENKLEDKESECSAHEDCPGVEDCSVTCVEGRCVPMQTPDGVMCGAEVNQRCLGGTCRELQMCANVQECPCNQTCTSLMPGVGVCTAAGETRTTGGCIDPHGNEGRCAGGSCRLACMDDSLCACDERCESVDTGGMFCTPIALRRVMGSCLREDGTTGTCRSVDPSCQ